MLEMGRGFSAVRHRNFRLYWIGQIVSLAGTWMQSVSQPWLVLLLGGSYIQLGIVVALQFAPSLLLAPLGGVLADRVDKRRLLIFTQSVAALQAAVLFALTATGVVEIWHIMVLALALGFVNALDMPGRQAFISAMIENKEDLPNAIALNSSMVNVARLLGPSIAGVVIAATNEGWCFAIDGVSYLGVIAALIAMRVAPRAVRSGPRPGAWQQFVEGWRYAFGFRPIRSIILLLALVSLVGVPYSVLMPIFAATVFHGGPHTLGFLMGASGCGALAGALWLATRRSVIGLGRIIVVASAAFGAGLIGFSFASSLTIAIPCLVVAGCGFIVQMASSNTIIQTIVDEDKRGRVMSFYMMAFLGTVPFGSLIAGWLSSRIGAPHTLLLGGICCLAGAAWFATELPLIRIAVRPIYIRMGILPQVAVGIADAAELSVPPE